jgi:hypothetical protein
MKIKFYKRTWCLERYTICGFTGTTAVRAIQVLPEKFEIVSIEREKRFVNIHAETDGCLDGENRWLINVPTALFEEIVS